MTTVRIWSLEPDYDAEAIKCLADKLVATFATWQSIHRSI